MSKTNEVCKRPPEPPEAGRRMAWEDVHKAEQEFGRIMAELMAPTGVTQFVAVAKTDERAAEAYRYVLTTWKRAKSTDLWRKVMDRVDEEFAHFGDIRPLPGIVMPDLRRAIGQFVVKVLGEQEASARDATETPA